jgi:hypothetical protein
MISSSVSIRTGGFAVMACRTEPPRNIFLLLQFISGLRRHVKRSSFDLERAALGSLRRAP